VVNVPEVFGVQAPLVGRLAGDCTDPVDESDLSGAGMRTCESSESAEANDIPLREVRV